MLRIDDGYKISSVGRMLRADVGGDYIDSGALSLLGWTMGQTSRHPSSHKPGLDFILPLQVFTRL